MKPQIKVTRTTSPKEKPDPNTLGFGKKFTDHMLIMDYDPENGWNSPRVIPYAPIVLDPAAVVFHYGQTMFEGLKAYKTKDGVIQLFRPDKNAERTNSTNKRICMPEIDPETYVECIKTLVDVDSDWIPEKEGTSLYIRPFIIGTEAFLGVHPSKTYMFIIILSPVGSYYEAGLAPTRIFVEDEYVRATPGGTGFAKIGANYVASMASQMKAEKLGFEQVLWLDGIERKYVEEIGTSNAFFVIDGEVYTAPLEGTILAGITRDSTIELLKKWGIPVHEKRMTIQEIFDASAEGRLNEVFATGTAAVVSPVGELCWGGDKTIIINDNKIGKLSQKIYDTLSGIQNGYIKDEFGWIVKVK
jgi:branched-chain amino acid aminotransferase